MFQHVFTKSDFPALLLVRTYNTFVYLAENYDSRSPPASNIIIRAAKYPLWCEFCPKKERAG